MNFQVPQFIEIEDKVIGPLTVKQFLYLAGSISAGGIVWMIIPYRIISAPIALCLIVFGIALAFYKYNGKPFVAFVENALQFLISEKLYIWRKKPKTPEKGERPTDAPNEGIYVPRLSDSKLRDLTWSLDINDKIE